MLYPLNLKHSTEDSGSLSNFSEVSSVQSIPSLVSDSSSVSLQDKYSSEATEHLACLLAEDPVLTPIYEAIFQLGLEKFHKHHDQLLKKLFRDLRSETRNSVELAMVRGLRNRDRWQKITSLILTSSDPLNVHKQRAMAILRDQKPNRRQFLNDYLGRVDSPKNLDQDDGSSDERASSNSSNENDANVNLEPLETFIRESNTFARFKSNFGYLLRPPTHLSEALNSRDIYIVQRFLAKNFTSAAISDHEWLHELDDAGYSKHEIAELLLESTNDSP